MARGGKPRLVRADRHQLRLESRSLDQLIAADHRARTLWHASERLELSALRAATIETIHGDLKEHRGSTRFRVRGLQRVQSCLVL